LGHFSAGRAPARRTASATASAAASVTSCTCWLGGRQHDAAEQGRIAGGVLPPVPGTPAARRLVVGDHDEPVGGAGARTLERHVVGRADLREVLDRVPAERPGQQRGDAGVGGESIDHGGS
jgi:hypothetical protein